MSTELSEIMPKNSLRGFAAIGNLTYFYVHANIHTSCMHTYIFLWHLISGLPISLAKQQRSNTCLSQLKFLL